MIKGNYYFIALKRDTNITAQPSRTATISAAKSNGDFVMQANKVAPANFSGTLREESTNSMQGGSSSYETTYGEGNTLLDPRGRLDSNLINTSLQTFRGWKLNELTFPGRERERESLLLSCAFACSPVQNVTYIKYHEKYYNRFWKCMAFDYSCTHSFDTSVFVTTR